MKSEEDVVRVYFDLNVLISLFLIERGAPHHSDCNGGLRNFPGSDLPSGFVEQVGAEELPFHVCSALDRKKVLIKKLALQDEMNQSGDANFFSKWWEQLVNIEVVSCKKPFPINRCSDTEDAHRILEAHWVGAPILITSDKDFIEYGEEVETLKYSPGYHPGFPDPVILSPEEFSTLDMLAINKAAKPSREGLVLPGKITKKQLLKDYAKPEPLRGAFGPLTGRASSIAGGQTPATVCSGQQQRLTCAHEPPRRPVSSGL